MTFLTYSKDELDLIVQGIDDRLKKTEDRVTKLETAPVPTPTPTSNVYDDYPTTYNLTSDNVVTSNGKWRLLYRGYNPSNSALRGQAGVRVPSAQPPNATIPRVYYAYPYNTPNTAAGTNASLTLSEADFSNFDMTFWMRTIKGWRSPAPKNWEVNWLLFRFNPAGVPITDKGAHFHHYFYDIQRNGVIEFGRKDNTQMLEEQTFLTTSGRVAYADGKWMKVRIKAEGNHFQNWVDDVLKFDIVDDGTKGSRSKQVIVNGVKTSVSMPVEPPSSFMSTGRVGLYAEDSEAEYGPLSIIPL